MSFPIMKALSIVATIALVMSISSGYFAYKASSIAFKASSEVSVQRINALVDAQLTAREMRFVESYTPKLREMFAPLHVATDEDKLRDWQSSIEVLLLRAEVATLAGRNKDADSLVAAAVQRSLAEDQSKLETLRAARRKEELDRKTRLALDEADERRRLEEEAQARMQEQIIAGRKSPDDLKQQREWDERREEAYNARRSAGTPESPSETIMRLNMRQPPKTGKMVVISTPGDLSDYLPNLSPMHVPPGFPRLAQLAKFVQNSTGPEIRDLALSKTRVAAMSFSDDEDSEWRKTIGDSCGISLKWEVTDETSPGNKK